MLYGLVIPCYTVNGLKPNIYVGGCSIYKVNICTIASHPIALVFLVYYTICMQTRPWFEDST